MQDELGLDWETYNTVDIRRGVYRYGDSPTLAPLLGAYQLNGGTIYQEDYTETPWLSPYLTEAFLDPNVLIRAFNAAFERIMIWRLWGIWVPIHRFRCTMVEAYSLSFFGKMSEVGAQLGLPDDLVKMEGGQALIHKFCKPAPDSHKADRYGPWNSEEKWGLFRQYNVQDVRAEAAIAQAIKPYAFDEAAWQEYFLDQRINDRGLPVDVPCVVGAIHIANQEKARLMAELRVITGLDNPNSGQQLLGWFEEQNFPLDNLKKAYIQDLLATELHPHVREVLELKSLLARTSVTKYKAINDSHVASRITGGQVLRGCFQFGGAQRTKRWAGRIFQPHNLPSSKTDNIETLTGVLATGDIDQVRAL